MRARRHLDDWGSSAWAQDAAPVVHALAEEVELDERGDALRWARRGIAETVRHTGRIVYVLSCGTSKKVYDLSCGCHIIDAHPAALNDAFLFHVRTASRKEIDFLAEQLGGVAVEAKYTEGGRWASEAATVNASQWDGLMCTRNVLDLTSDGAWAVPAAFLAYLVDS